jgi:signal transduction histidine kinase
MRWWLALAFAGIAALTALAVAQVFSARSEAAIRERARELAAGSAVTAALDISNASSVSEIRATAAGLAESRALSLFILDENGSLLTPERSRGIALSSLPNYVELKSTALSRRRVVETIDDGRLVTVALPLRGDQPGALIAVAARPDLEAALGIVRDEIVRAALWAVAIGALVGLGVALLITRRIRRIGAAAAEIEQGRFDRSLRPRFHDEVGTLAETIDSMRQRLRTSFDRLEGERDRLRRLLEQLQEGVIAVDRDLTVEFANTRAHRLLGADLSPGRALPEPWSTFALRDAVAALFDREATARTLRMNPDPARTFILALLPPAASPAGVIVITDVTEEERRERAEREFVTNAAHELRTPVAAIASAVEVLQQGAKENPPDRDRFLELVERQTARLTNLARALLTLARAQTRSEAVRLEPVRLEPLVSEIAGSVTAESVAVEVCCEDAEALAHYELLHHAIENLLANARRHAAGSEVTLRVEHMDGDKVRIDVADTGSGMTAPEMQRALDRFYRAPSADGDGFGLGLSIVREVVTAMDGTLSIESVQGKGTTVSIVLASPDTGRMCM